MKQENSYLFSNGVNFNDDGDYIKNSFGKNFDSTIFSLGNYALIDGVAWIYAYNEGNEMRFSLFRGNQYIPLMDEMTGEQRAGVRFWRVAEDKPMWVELYEIDGITTYKSNNGDIEVYYEKRPYTSIKSQSVLGTKVIGVKQYPVLPVFPLYANDLQESSLTQALQNKIDVYDLVISDFANNLEDSQDVYWVLKNYNGTDIDTFLRDYKHYKSIKVDEEGDATPHTIDIPYEARKEMLDILRKDIFESAMALNTDDLTGSSLTTVAIKANMQNLDLKTDVFEMNALSTLNNIVELYLSLTNQSIDYNIELIRRSLVNDTEIIDMIYTSREDLDIRTALELNPLIPNEKIDDIIASKEEEGINFNNVDNEEAE